MWGKRVTQVFSGLQKAKMNVRNCQSVIEVWSVDATGVLQVSHSNVTLQVFVVCCCCVIKALPDDEMVKYVPETKY